MYKAETIKVVLSKRKKNDKQRGNKREKEKNRETKKKDRRNGAGTVISKVESRRIYKEVRGRSAESTQQKGGESNYNNVMYLCVS